MPAHSNDDAPQTPGPPDAAGAPGRAAPTGTSGSAGGTEATGPAGVPAASGTAEPSAAGTAGTAEEPTSRRAAGPAEPAGRARTTGPVGPAGLVEPAGSSKGAGRAGTRGQVEPVKTLGLAGPVGPDEPAGRARTVGSGGVGRPESEGRPGAGRRRTLQLAACAAALAVAMTAGAVVLGSRDDGGTSTVSSAPGLAPELLASGSLAQGISALQTHLKAQPKDAGGWATLGIAYVEQARTNGDPSRYPQAQHALERSLELSPGNDPALAGRAALAAARHRFPEALRYAEKALEENAFNERALSVRVDALVELGRYGEASKAVDEADSRRPGVPVFTRYAYVRELRGDVRTARRVLEQALAGATAPGDVAYVASQLGQLSWREGEYGKALTYYERALRADGAYLPALEGRARAQAAGGDRSAAILGMEEVVARFPLPGPLVVLGELYEARGGEADPAKARAQYALVDAWTALARANGVNADLDTALAAADHGDRGAALRAARAEWERRETVHTADALAWALHVNGRDEEALRHTRRATATGYRDATFLYHRGMIERATGHEKEARDSLSAALELNPGFSPTGSALARKTLEALGGAR